MRFVDSHFDALNMATEYPFLYRDTVGPKCSPLPWFILVKVGFWSDVMLNELVIHHPYGLCELSRPLLK